MKPLHSVPAGLYVVATPLGNLKDITFRAVEILGSVPVIACEDTRHSRKLLDHYGIKARLISCHEHNEEAAARKVVSIIESGLPVALVSDAGTPGISDPGYRVVRLAAERGLDVVPIPGPCALSTALCAAGLPTDRVFFAGFLPPRSKALEKTLLELKDLRASLVFYSPARRIKHVLPKALEIFGNRSAALCRELTKIHEEFIRGTLSELISSVESRPQLRGEIVLIVEGRTSGEKTGGAPLAERFSAYIDILGEDAEAMGAKKLTAMASESLEEPRNRVYPLVCAYLNRLKEGS